MQGVGDRSAVRGPRMAPEVAVNRRRLRGEGLRRRIPGQPACVL